MNLVINNLMNFSLCYTQVWLKPMSQDKILMKYLNQINNHIQLLILINQLKLNKHKDINF